MNNDVILIDKNALLHELEEVESCSIAAARIIQAREQYTAESITLASLSVVRDVINDAPGIDPVKHGRWISIGEGYHWRFECSECHWKDGYPFDDRHSYCPCCGAKMGEPEGPLPAQFQRKDETA